MPPRRSATPRPARGTPEATRARLVAAAATVFNRDGYHGTDTNRLARAAGYAPATFYKHFVDKRAVFLAAYEAWVTSEWTQVDRVVRSAVAPPERAERIVRLTLAHHRRWKGLRASLRALVATDAAVRAAYRAQRRRQLELLAALRGAAAPARRERDALLLFTMERTCDAVADGEVRELGLSVTRLVTALEDEVRDALG
ncbi:MAG TPA: helix-turn-helix domain-containing protein [Candidatus Binatia bacterium]|jgi:AcrR family transcriptional regulator|nr:helix-turn-helix domain-containing protein [Candidatus Binatia bacterium]